MATLRGPQDAYAFADLEHLPDDGLRYEIVDGSLLVTPAPGTRHQRVVRRLLVLLDAACASGQEVFTAPVNFVISPTDVPQPDLIVAGRGHISDRGVEGTALLVVEVLSDRTMTADRTVKAAKYAQAGVPSYWIVDPDEPSVTALSLAGDVYVEDAVVRGNEPYRAQRPFPVTVVPAQLAAE